MDCPPGQKKSGRYRKVAVSGGSTVFFYTVSRCGAVLLNPSASALLINSINKRLNQATPQTTLPLRK